VETSAPVAHPSAASDATVYEPAKRPSVPVKLDMPAPTVAESAGMASSVTVPQVARPIPAPPAQAAAPPASKSKAGVLIAVGVVFVLLIAAGVGGFFLWKSSRPTGTNSTNVNNTGGAVSAPTEISRYWLELAPAAENGPTTRVAALVPLASGQSFKFHFSFNEEGYLYIFGPGDGNQPTAFLTSKPLPESGVTSNKVSKGVEFTFPRESGGIDNNLTLDKNPGTDNFTIIFSKTQLAAPQALNASVTGKPLSANERAELKAFVTKHQEQPPVTEPDESNSFVKVKVNSDQTGNPIVFDIRIQHN
jgi:hypothetical protein